MGTVKSRYTAEQIKKFQSAWIKCKAKAWADEKFKQKLLKNPEAVLKEMGADIPAGFQLKILENSSKVHYLVLDEKPMGEDLTEQDLLKVAGGAAAAAAAAGAKPSAAAAAAAAAPVKTAFEFPGDASSWV